MVPVVRGADLAQRARQFIGRSFLAALWLLAAGGPAIACDLLSDVWEATSKGYLRGPAFNNPSFEVAAFDDLRPQVNKSRTDANAHYRAGLRYLTGDGVPADPVQALAWIRFAATADDLDAQAHLVKMFMDERSIAQDESQARSWVIKHRSDVCLVGAFVLGTLYEDGVGGDADVERAMLLYQHAADRGFAPAQRKVGTFFEAGQRKTTFLGNALYWYDQAAAQGDRWSQAQRDRILVKVRKDAARGDKDAMFALATARDQAATKALLKTSEALALYRKGLALGDLRAAVRVSEMYGVGKGLRKDEVLSAALARYVVDEDDRYTDFWFKRMAVIDWELRYEVYTLAKIIKDAPDPLTGLERAVVERAKRRSVSDSPSEQ